MEIKYRKYPLLLLLLNLGGSTMKKLNINKIIQLRTKMHLSEAYLSKVLGCDLNEYKLIETGEFTPSKEQLEILSSVFAINIEQLFLTEDTEATILARTHKDLTDNDNRQINEFLSFQKLLGLKKEKSKEVVCL